MTDEHRSSKTCVFCFHELRIARSLVGGIIKTTKVNGTVKCVNPDCPSFRVGYTMKARDTHSAMAILVAGASNLLSPTRETLSPFTRQVPLGRLHQEHQ